MSTAMKIYAGAVVTAWHSGKVTMTPIYMQAVTRAGAIQAAYRAIKAKDWYDKELVYHNTADLVEITPEWLAEVGYQQVTP